LLEYADEKIYETNVVAMVIAANGRRVFGTSGVLDPVDYGPELWAAIQVTGHRGGCAEVYALSVLESEGVSLVGAHAQAVRVAGVGGLYTNAEHGTLIPMCSHCVALFTHLRGGPLA
jgi:hypothetical protein